MQPQVTPPQATPPPPSYPQQPHRHKDPAPAYVLWVIPGLILGLSVHRFYLGATNSAIIQLLLSLVQLVLIIAAIVLLVVGAFDSGIVDETGMVDEMVADMLEEGTATEGAGAFAGGFFLFFLSGLFGAVRFVWHIVDLFLIPGILRQHNDEQLI